MSESKLVKDFLAMQAMLMDPVVTKPTNNRLVKPEEVCIKEETPEDLYNEILEKRPGKKKVLRFLQVCIDSVLEDD